MIYLDDEVVKIGGIILPGTFKSLEVGQDAKVDEEEVEGASSKPKQANGYDDANIKIEISLMDSENGQTKEEKLLLCQSLFRAPGQDNPVVHELVSVHTAIRGIQNVILKNMTSKETNKKDEITVSLELLQYDVMTITASRATAASKGTEAKGTATAGPAAVSIGGSASGLSASYQSYISSARGSAPKQKNKTSKSPAVDR